MADEKISDLPSASSVTGADLVPIVQGGANKKSTLIVFKTFLQSTLSFLGLSDTPNSYTGKSNNRVKVTTDETALTFIIDSFLNLVDAPNTYSGKSDNLVKVTNDESGLTFIDSTNFTSLAFKTISVSGQSNVIADSAADTLTLAEGTNITITTDASTDTITIAGPSVPTDLSALHFVTTQTEAALSNEFSLGSLTTGLLKHSVTGSVSTPATATPGTDYTDNAFKTISVSGQSDVVADSAADTLTLAAGTNITITTNASTDTVTITAAGSAAVHAVTLSVDGSGAVLSTGTKNAIKIPYGGTLTGWLINGSPSGSVTVDIFRSADGAGLPVTSIVGAGTKPALSTATENSSTSFTSWTSTTLTAKDNLAISLSGITASTYVSLTLYFS